MHLNDEILRATGADTLNEGLSSWFSRTASESLQDAESRFLLSQAAVTVLASINGMWFTFLRAAPQSRTGALMDMKLQYWTAQP